MNVECLLGHSGIHAQQFYVSVGFFVLSFCHYTHIPPQFHERVRVGGHCLLIGIEKTSLLWTGVWLHAPYLYRSIHIRKTRKNAFFVAIQR